MYRLLLADPSVMVVTDWEGNKNRIGVVYNPHGGRAVFLLLAVYQHTKGDIWRLIQAPARWEVIEATGD